MIRRLSLLFLVVVSLHDGVHALSNVKPSQPAKTSLSRSDVLRTGFLSVSAMLIGPTVVYAAEERTIYNTGKAPIVPGAKPKDKNNFSGTKKDPNFLRSIADCKSQCESKGKPKDECLSECQDICCTTYEQVGLLFLVIMKTISVLFPIYLTDIFRSSPFYTVHFCYRASHII